MAKKKIVDIDFPDFPSHWNYRVVTKLKPHPIEGRKPIRVFFISEVYYQEGSNIPDSYIDASDVISDFESADDLGWALDHAMRAYNWPVLDLDNWPNEYRKKDFVEVPTYKVKDWETWGGQWELFNGIPVTQDIDKSDPRERWQEVKTKTGVQRVPKYTEKDLQLWDKGWILKNGIPFRKPWLK